MIAALALATAIVVAPPAGFVPSTANAFREGVAHVTYDRPDDHARMEGFLGPDGRWAVAPVRRATGGGLHAHEGYLRVRDGRGYKFLDPEGRTRFSLGQAYAGDVHDGRVAFQDGGMLGWNPRMGYADTAGKVVVPALYDFAGDFDHGVAVVKRGEKFGLVDRDGKLVLQIRHDFVKNAGDGLVSVTTDGRSWIADTSGQRAIARTFQGIGYFRGGRGVVGELGDPADVSTIVDKAGQAVIPPQFEAVSGFSQGLACVRIGDRASFVDRQGRVVLDLGRSASFSPN
jgi:hypothetical protein